MEPAGSDTIEVIDSTTEQSSGASREGTPEDVDRAVKAARAGFEAWREVPVEQRVEALHGDQRGARRARGRDRAR